MPQHSLAYLKEFSKETRKRKSNICSINQQIWVAYKDITTLCFTISYLENGIQTNPLGIFFESPHPLSVALNASIVDDGVEAGVQDEEDDNEDVSVLVGAGHEAQEDEGL